MDTLFVYLLLFLANVFVASLMAWIFMENSDTMNMKDWKQSFFYHWYCGRNAILGLVSDCIYDPDGTFDEKMQKPFSILIPIFFYAVYVPLIFINAGVILRLAHII